MSKQNELLSTSILLSESFYPKTIVGYKSDWTEQPTLNIPLIVFAPLLNAKNSKINAISSKTSEITKDVIPLTNLIDVSWWLYGQ